MKATAVTLAAAGAVATAIALAPVSSADPVCVQTGLAKHCSNPGNAQITVNRPPMGPQACFYGVGYVCTPSITWNFGGLFSGN